MHSHLPYTDDATIATQQNESLHISIASIPAAATATAAAVIPESTIVNDDPLPRGVIAVSSEHVIVPPDDSQRDDEHFIKNTQRVDIM